MTRRELLQLAVTSAAAAAPAPLVIAGKPVELVVAAAGKYTVRVSLLPLENDRTAPVRDDGSLVRNDLGDAIATVRSLSGKQRFSNVELTPDPLSIRIEAADGRVAQQLRIDPAGGSFTFQLGTGPIYGLGEGGRQYDRRGSADEMINGQGGYRLHTHGGRVPIPWLIGTSGWAMFVHQPYGKFDLRGAEGRFTPTGSEPLLPLDLFVVTARDPAEVMAEYARLTGFPEMPPLWALGYQQSHRTLASREEVVLVAETFRQKRLPCDALIYLGTGFCPSGWNADNGSFAFNRKVFDDPPAVLGELHARHFRVVLHAVILADRLRGSARDACDLARFDEQQAGCYWDMHRRLGAMGVDAWWPDEGDPMDAPSRLVRNRMYWEGPQIDRPNERPYALHRNGYAGMQRFASFLWSGDVYSTWETLRAHVPIALNTGLTGIPYWGTDTGGFVPTRDFTGELYVRWFQFSAFCPLFRSHGRTWKLRLPWGWNTGETGPTEIGNYPGVADPGPEELHNAQVEPICRKYLELRYRLLPYLYTAVREAHDTGMPVMRAMWLHHPDDPKSVATGDQYFWGRDILVAPVTEKGAVSRKVYLPKGSWYDFWTNERIEGAREITRSVDLATLPLYVRAGAIIPFGPLKQYTAEKVDGPLTLRIYPGADGLYTLYEDDGLTFKHRSGDWTRLAAQWNERARTLRISLAAGGRVPANRNLEVQVGSAVRTVTFDGKPVEVRF